MGYTTLSVVAPHATAYDEDYPTRSTENYSHALHEILQDMEDATGAWYFDDNTPSASEFTTFRAWVHDEIEDVFDYAEGAIDTYRSSGTPTLAKPTATDVPAFVSQAYEGILEAGLRLTIEIYKVKYFIYYMWKTEEDPLLLKEKLQELLIAWPLLDTTIELSSELGQQFKVYPSWKNADLDL